MSTRQILDKALDLACEKICRVSPLPPAKERMDLINAAADELDQQGTLTLDTATGVIYRICKLLPPGEHRFVIDPKDMTQVKGKLWYTCFNEGETNHEYHNFTGILVANFIVPTVLLIVEER